MRPATDRSATAAHAMTPDFKDVLAAAARIAPHAHVTPVLRSRSLDALAGCEIHFKCEQLQRAGAFKFRGACNAVWSLSDAEAARGVVTSSAAHPPPPSALPSPTRVNVKPDGPQPAEAHSPTATKSAGEKQIAVQSANSGNLHERQRVQ